MKRLTKVGEENYEKFRKNLLEDRIASIDEPIKRNNLPLPKNPRLVIKSKQTTKVKNLRIGLELFAKMYMSHRESDRDQFFRHEVQAFPAALADNGQMHFPSAKSELIKCLDIEVSLVVPKTYDCIILDGAAIVHFLSPESKILSFQEHTQKVFIPYLEDYLKICERIDVVFDQYTFVGRNIRMRQNPQNLGISDFIFILRVASKHHGGVIWAMISSF